MVFPIRLTHFPRRVRSETCNTSSFGLELALGRKIAVPILVSIIGTHIYTFHIHIRKRVTPSQMLVKSCVRWIFSSRKGPLNTWWIVENKTLMWPHRTQKRAKHIKNKKKIAKQQPIGRHQTEQKHIHTNFQHRPLFRRMRPKDVRGDKWRQIIAHWCIAHRNRCEYTQCTNYRALFGSCAYTMVSPFGAT